MYIKLTEKNELIVEFGDIKIYIATSVLRKQKKIGICIDQNGVKRYEDVIRIKEKEEK